MKLDKAIRQLAKAEHDLADDYARIGQRHAGEHDVYHTCMTLRQQCAQHVEMLAPSGARYGADVAEIDDPDEVWSSVLAHLRQGISAMSGRSQASGLLLLRDLRRLYHAAYEVSFLLTTVAQAAQAARDKELLDVVSALHPQTLTQIKWITTKLKETAPQVLVGG